MGSFAIESHEINFAYENALKHARMHYENFPVISLFLPSKLRKHVAVVYQFARQADDLADEGSGSLRKKIDSLEEYENLFKDCIEGKYADSFWSALNHTITEFNLTPKYFFDLLSAFKQDVYKNFYRDFDEILYYCERSANPVGRIILEFFDIRDKESIEYSDAVCTALQLTNFYQDISVDVIKNRIYIPEDELKKFDINSASIFQKEFSDDFKDLLKYQVERTKLLFQKGRKLLPRLGKNLRFQIRLTILGGEEILRKIEKINYNTLNIRPKLSKMDYSKLFFKAVTS